MKNFDIRGGLRMMSFLAKLHLQDECSVLSSAREAVCPLFRIVPHCQTAAWYNWNISVMKQQFVVNHLIRQTEIPALLDGWVTNTPSV